MAIGDVTVKGLEGRSYTVNFGVNAMCRLEEQIGDGTPYHQMIAEIRTGVPRMTTIRRFFKAGMVDPKPESDEQAGEILEDIGGAVTVIAALMQSEQAIASKSAQPAIERPVRRRATRKAKQS